VRIVGIEPSSLAIVEDRALVVALARMTIPRFLIAPAYFGFNRSASL